MQLVELSNINKYHEALSNGDGAASLGDAYVDASNVGIPIDCIVEGIPKPACDIIVKVNKFGASAILGGGGQDAATKAACGSKPSMFSPASKWSKYHNCVQNLNAKCSTPGEIAAYDVLLNNPTSTAKQIGKAITDLVGDGTANNNGLIKEMDREIAYFHSIGENPASDKFPCLANHKSIYIDYAGRLSARLKVMGSSITDTTAITNNNNNNPPVVISCSAGFHRDESGKCVVDSPNWFTTTTGIITVSGISIVAVLTIIVKSKGWF